MVEGYQIEKDYNRGQYVELLYLQRKMLTVMFNFMQSFDKNGKPVDELDLLPIPEVDKMIKKSRKQKKRKQEERAEKVLHHYKNLPSIGKRSN